MPYKAYQNIAQNSTSFGTPLYNRGFSFSSYRYGFNKKEKDDEVMGAGNCIDYGKRVSDTRLGGRFFSVDPLTKDYPWYSPYQFAGNKPIWAIDLDGAEEVIRNKYTWNGIPWLTISSSVKIADRAEGHKQTINGNIEYVEFTNNNVNPSNDHLTKSARAGNWRPSSVKSISDNSDYMAQNHADKIHQNNNVDAFAITVQQNMFLLFPVNVDKNTTLADNPQVQIVAVALLKFDNLSVTITGSASSGGDPVKNARLAQNRAEQYKNAIIKVLQKGNASAEQIAKVTERIQTTSKVATGANNPADQNATIQVNGDLHTAVKSVSNIPDRHR